MLDIQPFAEDYARTVAGRIAAFVDEQLFEALRRNGITIDMEKERVARFKKIAVEQRGDVMTYYYNDGSTGGLKLVTIHLPGSMKLERSLEELKATHSSEILVEFH